MSIRDRILSFAAFKRLSVRAFEISIGASNGYLRKTQSVSGEVCAHILETYPELNADWLIKGEGEMLISSGCLTNLSNMVLSDRIRAIVKYSKLSIPKFSKLVGFKTPQAVRELLAGHTKTLSDSAKYKLLAAFPELNPTWLTLGEGEMLNTKCPRTMGDVSGGAMATQGDNSPILKDVSIDLGKDENEDEEEGFSADEVQKLQKLLAEAQMEIARLNGRLEEQGKFIKMLLEGRN